MENSPTESLLSSSDNANGVVPEQTLPTPHFDEISIQNARPAVPLEPAKPRRFWPLALVLMCTSSLVGAVLGLALSRYENRSEPISTSAANVAPEGSGVSIPTSRDSDRVVTTVSTGSGSDGVSTGSGSDRIGKLTQTEIRRSAFAIRRRLRRQSVRCETTGHG